MNPVKLFISSSIIELRTACAQALKKYFCLNKNAVDCYCKGCSLILQQIHPNTIYIEPKHSYTKSDIEPILVYSAQKRSTSEPLFFILEHPEFLLPAAANSLLKTLEEPGENIFFIFLSQNANALLPTILSRCDQEFIKNSTDQDLNQNDELLLLILEIYNQQPITAQKIDAILQKKSLEKEISLKILNDFIVQITADENSARKSRFINLAYTFCTTPPAPGSGKIFWRTLILSALEIP
ncbi:hypothetical protein FJ366_01005 [Candidatus Dependentiae bacterium]|nr:hypothetical protein [Candidatus Dependentiae bacterium]